MLNEVHLYRERQELEQRKHEVRLDREVSVWSLQKVPFTDPSHFRRHTAHIFDIANVLDNGVRVNDVELLIAILPQNSWGAPPPLFYLK